MGNRLEDRDKLETFYARWQDARQRTRELEADNRELGELVAAARERNALLLDEVQRLRRDLAAARARPPAMTPERPLLRYEPGTTPWRRSGGRGSTTISPQRPRS